MERNDLISEARAGSDSAFCQLVNIYKGQMYKIAYAYFYNEQDALEAVQEATCRAYLNIKKLKKPEYFKTWLIRILINYCIDEKKQKKRQELLKEDAAYDSSSLDEDSVEIRQLLYNLQPKHRQVVILKYFEDLTIREISEILNRPEGTVKTWLNQALNSLRDMMGEEDENIVVK